MAAAGAGRDLAERRLVSAWLTHVNPFAGSPSAFERLVVVGDSVAEWPPFDAEAGSGAGCGDRGCQTVLVSRTVTRPALVRGEDGQLRVEDRRVQRSQLV
jgi:hypothetical protein